jgi:hypothetical protein
MPIIPVVPNHPAASAACRMAGERTPRAPLCKSPPQVAKTKVKAVIRGALPATPRHNDVAASVAAASVATATGAAAGPAAVFAHANSAAAAGNVALPALSVDSSSSSASDDLEMTGGDGTALGLKSTGLTDLTDSPPTSPTFSEEDLFAADGNDVDAYMPTNAEASKYSFLDRLKH